MPAEVGPSQSVPYFPAKFVQFFHDLATLEFDDIQCSATRNN